MEAIVIRSNSKENLKLLMDLAKQLGSSVIKLKEDQLEDLHLGELMKNTKTGKAVSREAVMNKLK